MTIQLYNSNTELYHSSFSNWYGWVCGVTDRSIIQVTDIGFDLSFDWELWCPWNRKGLLHYL